MNRLITLNGVRYIAVDEEENFKIPLSDVAKKLEEIVGEINDEDLEITQEDVIAKLQNILDEMSPKEEPAEHESKEVKEDVPKDEASITGGGRLGKRLKRRNPPSK